MANTINDLLTKNVATIAAIIDLQTDADAAYIEDYIVSALKDVAVGVFPSNTLYITDILGLGIPFYNSLSSLITDIAVDPTLIKILAQPADDANITINSGGTFILDAPHKDKFYIITDDDITGGIYRNVKIKYTTGKLFTNCVFENCSFYEKNATAGSLEMEGCEIKNCYLDCDGGSIVISNSSGFNNTYFASSVEIDNALLLNIFKNVLTVVTTNNNTNDLNITI